MNELSDKNKPRNLEDIFREGMGEAEVTPSDRLWERIDHKLDTKEAVFYKERMVWFQRLAAACILLVLFTGGYLFYNNNTIESPQLATSEKLPTRESAEPKGAAKTKSNTADAKVEQPQIATNNHSTNETTIAAKNQRLPVSTKGNSFKNIYGQSRNNERTIAVKKSAIESGKIIDVAGSNKLAIKANNPAIALMDEPQPEEAKLKVNNDQAFAKSWTGISNKASTLDTTATIALNKSLPLTAEPGAAVASNETTKKRSSRWTVSGKYASHYFNQNIALAGNSSAVAGNGQSSFLPPATNTSSNFSEAMQEYDKNTMASYSYNTSLGAAYQLNNHWAIETGLAYTQNVATTNSSYIFNNSQATREFNNLAPNDNIDKDNVVSVPTTALLASLVGSTDLSNVGVVKTEAFDTQYRYRLIGIPIKVNYKTNGEKSFYYVSGGLLTNFLVQAHILSASPVVPDIKYGANTESPFNDLQMAGTISVGKGFKITKGFSLRAGLEASKYLTSLAANPEHIEGKHGKPYTIGIALSSSYSLGK